MKSKPNSNPNSNSNRNPNLNPYPNPNPIRSNQSIHGCRCLNRYVRVRASVRVRVKVSVRVRVRGQIKAFMEADVLIGMFLEN